MRSYGILSRAPLLHASTFHVKAEKKRARLSTNDLIQRPDGTMVEEVILVDEEPTIPFTAALTIQNNRDQTLHIDSSQNKSPGNDDIPY